MSGDWTERMRELGEATAPTEAEVAKVDGKLEDDVLRAMRIVTQPTDAEVARVAARLREARTPTPAPWGRGLALAAGLILAVGSATAWSFRFGPVDLPEDRVVALSEPVSIGLATTAEGAGSLRLIEADRAHTVVEVVAGAVTFEVDPQARYRDVAVRTGEVEVRVRGTRFTVTEDEQVSVERGEVEVYRQDVAVASLTAGQRWRPAPKVVSVPKPTPPRMEPPGWKPHARPRPPVEAVISVPVLTPSTAPAPASAPVVAPAPKASAARAFQSVLSRAEDGRDAGILAADWSIFLGSYPDAPTALRTEARARRLEAWMDALPPEEAVDKIAAFRVAEPTHPRRFELAYAEATLRRGDLADCVGALPAYAAAAAGGGELAARALVFTAVCELHLGRVEAAAAAVDEARAIGLPEDVERYARKVERQLSRPR